MADIPTFTLNSGNKIPSIALGTWKSPNDVASDAVFTAIKDGYRHIDTASHYLNEEGVGAGIQRAITELGVKREDLFITTKVWLDDYHNIAKALDVSLKNLFPGEKNPYLDLYLVHWPFALLPNSKEEDKSITFNEVWAQFEELPTTKVKDIGVSNFTIKNLKKLLSTAKKTPAVNQVELHINLPQRELIEFLLSGKYGFPQHDGKIITPEAYCPLGHGNLGDPVIAKIAEEHKTQPANIVLSWGISRHTVVLPKSVTCTRIRSNLNFIELSEEEKKTIDELAIKSPTHRHCPMEAYNVFDE